MAVLLVHGVGRQRRGDTVEGFCRGLESVYGDRISVEKLEPDDVGTRLVIGPRRSVAVIEVHWADLLEGEAVKGTFALDEVLQLVWFPRLNLQDGSLPASMQKRVRSWTRKLVALGPLAFAGMYALQWIAILTMWLQPRRVMRQSAEWRSLSSWERMRRPLHVATWFDDIVDDVAGDVFNYVRGTENAFPIGSAEESRPFGTVITPERATRLCANVTRIHERFDRAAEHAVQLGCREIQVVAHSLGTVVAWRAMTTSTRHLEPAAGGDPAPAKLTRFLTIGSPLNKIRFFWPRLVRGVPHRPSITDHAGRVIAASDPAEPLEWLNLYSKRDPVSGELERFDGWPEPESRVLEGLGGVITAHTAYLSNAEFVSAAGTQLFGESPKTLTAAGFWKRLWNRSQGWLLPLGLITLVLLGFSIILGFGWLVGWIFGLMATWVGLGALADGLRIVMVVSMFLGLTVGQYFAGRSHASEVHRRYWAGARAGEPPG